MSNYRPIITSVGIEVEFANISMEDAKSDRKIRNVWKIVRDGSCTRRLISLPNGEEITFSQRFHPDDASLYGLYTKNVGGEFVSPVFNIEEEKWFDAPLYLLDKLKEWEEGIDLRTGIHVHINIQTPPLYCLHNLVKLALSLESPMYRLSCGELGYHRGGRHKDYMYCRPLSLPGPQVVKDSMDLWRPVFDAKKLLRSNSINEFFMACGRLDLNQNNKWHQSRYVWLNFASILLHHTIEFRLFNSTLDHNNLLAWVELCSHLVSHSLGKGILLTDFPLGNTELNPGREYSLDDFLTETCITNDELSKKLEHLWSAGDWQPAVKGHQKGHLNHRLDLSGISDSNMESLIADEVDIRDVHEVTEDNQESAQNIRISGTAPNYPRIGRILEEMAGNHRRSQPTMVTQSIEAVEFNEIEDEVPAVREDYSTLTFTDSDTDASSGGSFDV